MTPLFSLRRICELLQEILLDLSLFSDRGIGPGYNLIIAHIVSFLCELTLIQNFTYFPLY